ncbi:hypothetical protein BN903_377 [Halorubrum sp. AJ67]|nr:hypothetical protein BN903_377 [Halorubrum sp. AJ67]
MSLSSDDEEIKGVFAAVEPADAARPPAVAPRQVRRPNPVDPARSGPPVQPGLDLRLRDALEPAFDLVAGDAPLVDDVRAGGLDVRVPYVGDRPRRLV